MEISTAWVKPPSQIGGLDHLAVQAPCINIYGRLLPGITNVTDRARYYSFYPWIVWALEQRGYKFNEIFIDRFRKADCLFTLIAERHAHVTGTDRDNHSAATVGSLNLSKQISDVREGKPVRLSDYAHREEGKHQYFQNKLGGLGQYYLGVLSALNIMDGTMRSGVKYTNQIGQVLAKAMDNHVLSDLFIQTIENDVVFSDRLDQLSCFCPCQLTSSEEEHALLCDLFFVKGLFIDLNMLPRRRSLQTILYLANDLAKQEISIDLTQFRGCVYSNALPNGQSWKLPDDLEPNRKRWSIYQRNELLSISVQGLFYVLLDTYENSGQRFDSVNDLCRWFVSTPEVEGIEDVFNLETTIGAVERECRDWLPEFPDWTHPDHEIQQANKTIELCKQETTASNRSDIVKTCLKILLSLKIRSETTEGYGDFLFPGDYFQVYPINLNSFLNFSEHEWKDLSVRECIVWLCSNWGVNAHLQVALRKLRGQSQSTFRIRPSDFGLEVIDVPKAVFTSPRFNQALRIIKDIGALVKEGDIWKLSALGMMLREYTDA
ncbi:MAG TPA: hypothetical protein PLK94_06375 [Alphaproteobacteria bacterium]|nr:hypothetical protein [Alphaproteobacteria bacterium]HPQ45170.1 hypothetical protein [Syntrophales bacterium]